MDKYIHTHAHTCTHKHVSRDFAGTRRFSVTYKMISELLKMHILNIGERMKPQPLLHDLVIKAH